MSSRITRLTIGFAVLSAVAVAPAAAQAQDTDLGGTLTGAGLVAEAPDITAFTAPLTGVTRAVTTDVGGWNVSDLTGTNAGYTITVSATAPTVGGTTAGAGTGATITMSPVTAAAAAGNEATVGPAASGPQVLTTDGATIQAAAAGEGQGQWDFAAAADSLSVVIPSNASAGAYASTLTFTTGPPV